MNPSIPSKSRSGGLKDLNAAQRLLFPWILAIAGFATLAWELAAARFLPRRKYESFDFKQHQKVMKREEKLSQAS